MKVAFACVLLLGGLSLVLGSDGPTRFLGIGYNLLTGNPDGGLLSRGGIDPGLLITRNILDLSSPEAVKYKSRRSCAEARQKWMYYGGKSYQKKLQRGVNLGVNVGARLATFAFSLSNSFQQAREQTTKERKIFIDDQEICNLGRVRFAEEVAHVYSRVTENFAAALCNLPSFYNKFHYMKFLDKWGTHVTTEVELGYKNTSRYESTLTEFIDHVSSSSSSGVSIGGSYKGFGGSVGVNFEDYKSSSNFQQQFGSYKKSLITGSLSHPEPIGLTVIPIHDVLNTTIYWQNSPVPTLPHVCSLFDLSSVSAQEKLSALRANLVQALKDYPSYKNVEELSDPELRIPITWPKGTYGLYKPNAGCPYNKNSFEWFQGWVYQDCEDWYTRNGFSWSMHLYGISSYSNRDNIKTHFCIKGQSLGTEFDRDWPRGDYCIAKYGHCPRGFSYGWLWWDDEDSDNRNRRLGYLPDGVYGRNTLIKYCCRKDGLPTNPITLPTESPFYLLRHTRTCQTVANMNVVDEYVYWDEEDDLWNDDIKCGGSHPYDSGNSNNHKLHFCYYTPK